MNIVCVCFRREIAQTVERTLFSRPAQMQTFPFTKRAPTLKKSIPEIEPFSRLDLFAWTLNAARSVVKSWTVVLNFFTYRAGRCFLCGRSDENESSSSAIILSRDDKDITVNTTKSVVWLRVFSYVRG